MGVKKFADLVDVAKVSCVIGCPFAAIRIGVATDHRHWPAGRIIKQSVDNVEAYESTSADDDCWTKSIWRCFGSHDFDNGSRAGVPRLVSCFLDQRWDLNT